MKSLLRFLLLTFFGSTITKPVTAQSRRVIITAPFILSLGSDAEAHSLGGAGVSTKPNANSAFWNPANIHLENSIAGFSVSSTFLHERYEKLFNASSVFKLSKKQYGSVFFRYLDLGTSAFPALEFAGLWYQSGLSLSYSYNLGSSLTIGGSINGVVCDVIYNQLLKPGKAVTGSFGLIKNINTKTNIIRCGIAITDLGSRFYHLNDRMGDFLPTTLRTGLSASVKISEYHGLNLSFELNKLLAPSSPLYDTLPNGTPKVVNGKKVILKGKDRDRSSLNVIFTSFYDAPGGFKEELSEIFSMAGVEYNYRNLLFFKSGINYQPKSKGGGLQFTWGPAYKIKNFKIALASDILKSKEHVYVPLYDLIISVQYYIPK